MSVITNHDDKNGGFDTYNPDDPISGFAGIPHNMTGIATKLKVAGYATYQVGKWHAGGATPDHIPTGRGPLPTNQCHTGG